MSAYLPYLITFSAVAAAAFFWFRDRISRASVLQGKSEIGRLELTLELSEHIGRFGHWHFEQGSAFVRWSDHVFEMHRRPLISGYPSLQEAINYYHPDDKAPVEAAVALALETGEDFEFSARVVALDGTETPVLARGTCRFSPDGTVLGIFGCIFDLTSR